MNTRPDTKPDHEDPEAEIQRLKDELRARHDMYLRAVADCDNYRKRVERDQAKTIRNGRRDLILTLIEITDELERAFQHSGQSPEALEEGIQIVYRLLLTRMAAEGIVPFASEGEAFDPRYHEAVATEAKESCAPGTVIEEIQKGYRWGDEVLRPAKVIVAR